MKQNETIPGGRYLTAQGWVDANGNPVKPPKGYEQPEVARSAKVAETPEDEIEEVSSEEAEETEESVDPNTSGSESRADIREQFLASPKTSVPGVPRKGPGPGRKPKNRR